MGREATLIKQLRADKRYNGALLVLDVGRNDHPGHEDEHVIKLMSLMPIDAAVPPERDGKPRSKTQGPYTIQILRTELKDGFRVDYTIRRTGTEETTKVLVEATSEMKVTIDGKAVTPPDHDTLVSVDLEKDAKKPTVTEIPVDEKLPEDPTVAQAIAERKSILTDRLVAQIARLSTKNPAKASPVDCASCHPAAYSSWLRSKHAGAMETLRTHDGLRSECVTCHSTRFREGTAIDLEQASPADSVACGSCHVGSEAHALDPTVLFKSKADEKICLPCHTAENSKRFNFAEYVKRVHPKENQ